MIWFYFFYVIFCIFSRVKSGTVSCSINSEILSKKKANQKMVFRNIAISRQKSGHCFSFGKACKKFSNNFEPENDKWFAGNLMSTFLPSWKKGPSYVKEIHQILYLMLQVNLLPVKLISAFCEWCIRKYELIKFSGPNAVVCSLRGQISLCL